MENVRMEYYTAAWCGPCKMMVQPIAELKAAGWNIEKIDADQNRDLVIQNQIAGIPTFLIYKDGELVQRFSGAKNKSAIETILNRVANS